MQLGERILLNEGVLNTSERVDPVGVERGEKRQGTVSRRGMLFGGVGLGVTVGLGAGIGVPEYRRRKAETEKQEARQEYLNRTHDMAQLLIGQIDDPGYSADGSRPQYEHDSEAGLLTFTSAERKKSLNTFCHVSIVYPVEDGESDFPGAGADVLSMFILTSQPSRLEVYEGSPSGETVNYITVDKAGRVSYNHAFATDDFVNPYDDLPAMDLHSIEPTLNAAHEIITAESLFM